jgi:hypothetical protein
MPMYHNAARSTEFFDVIDDALAVWAPVNKVAKGGIVRRER